MANIKAIGFDMDHTLADYIQEEFEKLAFEKALDKFIGLGYPKELAKLQFDPNFIIRGLLVDVSRGNLLKVDGHRYVKTAYHGRKKLTKDERTLYYNSKRLDTGKLRSVDTFFGLSEIQLYAEIMDYMNKHPDDISKTFDEVYRDVKYCIDKSHRDGSIKTEVLKDPSKYIQFDERLAETLQKLINSGKSLFLLTNSQWDYTNKVMSFLLPDGKGTQDNWKSFFEYIIVGSGKPDFFTGRQPFYEVMTDTGYMKPTADPLRAHCFYHGGSAGQLEQLLNVKGDEILYVGDHIYGDIIHSKNKLNWRTMLVVRELENELRNLDALKKNLADIKKNSSLREEIEEQLHSVVISANKFKKAFTKNPPSEDYRLKAAKEKLEKYETDMTTLEKKISEYTKKINELEEKRSQTFHPIWGELLRTGLERSRFADQITDYACIYTSKVTNFFRYNPFKKFTSIKDRLPHEF